MLDSHTSDFINPVFMKGLRHLFKSAILPIIIVVQLFIDYNYHLSLENDYKNMQGGSPSVLWESFSTIRTLLMVITGFLIALPFLYEKDREGLDISLGTRISPFCIMRGQLLTLAVAFLTIYLTSLPIELAIASSTEHPLLSDISAIASAFFASMLLSVISRKDTHNTFLSVSLGVVIIFLMTLFLHVLELDNPIHPLFFVIVKLCLLAVLAIHLAASYSPYSSRHGHLARSLSLALAIAFVPICMLFSQPPENHTLVLLCHAFSILAIIQGFLAITAPTMPLRHQIRGLSTLHWKNGFSLFSPEAVPSLLLGYVFSGVVVILFQFYTSDMYFSSNLSILTLYGLLYASIIVLLKQLGVSSSKACGLIIGIFCVFMFLSVTIFDMGSFYSEFSLFFPSGRLNDIDAPSVLLIGLAFLLYPAFAYYQRALTGRRQHPSHG